MKIGDRARVIHANAGFLGELVTIGELGDRGQFGSPRAFRRLGETDWHDCGHIVSERHQFFLGDLVRVKRGVGSFGGIESPVEKIERSEDSRTRIYLQPTGMIQDGDWFEAGSLMLVRPFYIAGEPFVDAYPHLTDEELPELPSALHLDPRWGQF